MERTLEQLIAEARNRKMSLEEQEEQRINFAVGNQAHDDNATVESVRAAAEFLRKTA